MEIYQNYYDYSNLPPHILVEIISRLKLDDFKNAVLTCKTWYCASFDNRVTKKILISGLTDSTCIDYLQRPIQNIRLSAVNLNKFNFRKLLRIFGHTIKDFDILFPNLATTRIYEMFIYLTNVKKVKIHFSSHYYSPQNFNLFKRIHKYHDRIAQNLKNIKFLTMNIRLRNLQPMQSFISECTNVKTLIWNEWIYQPNDQTEFLCDFLLEPKQNPMITNLNDLLIGSIDPSRSNEVLEKLVDMPLLNLKRLHLKEIEKHHYDNVFHELCKVYSFLDEFALNGCNDHQLHDICKYMSNLKLLAIDNCIATNFEEMEQLAHLESLHINRVGTLQDDKLLAMLNLKRKKLTKLSLNIINSNIFKFICEEFLNLEQLILEGVSTKDCEPIFRNQTNLKVLNLTFMEPATCHSSRIQSSDEYNVTRLAKLQDLYVSCFVPGITPTLIDKLPNLNTFSHTSIYDPTEEEFLLWRLTEEQRNRCIANVFNNIPNHYIMSNDNLFIEFYITDFNFDLFDDFIY